MDAEGEVRGALAAFTASTSACRDADVSSVIFPYYGVSMDGLKASGATFVSAEDLDYLQLPGELLVKLAYDLISRASRRSRWPVARPVEGCT
jgi:hypothetical protein